MKSKGCEIPKEVFHYTKAHTAIEKILFEKKIRFNQLKSMNDPKESKGLNMPLGIGVPPIPNGQWSNDFKDYIKNTPPKIKEWESLPLNAKFICYKDHIASAIKGNEWKIFCTSKHHPRLKDESNTPNSNSFLYGYARPSMWAHYADNHKGVCL